MNKFMREALAEAQLAFDLGEVPVGAVVVRDGEIIARGHNLTEQSKDPTAHAEMLALREAARVLGGWRLTGCSLYVTVEPCSMCAGAMVWARIEHLYIGTMDPKAGACGSVFNIVQEDRLNHSIDVETGIMEEECRQMMKAFFAQLRNRKKNNKSEE
jgi:tRNA(adenine34) deaminase